VGHSPMSLHGVVFTWFSTGTTLSLPFLFDIEAGGDIILRNVGLTFSGLHGVILQKIVIFIKIKFERTVNAV
jgi:hypothetical protein